MSSDDESRRTGEGCPAKDAGAIACVVGLTIGFFDVARTLLFKPTEFTSLVVFLTQLAIASAFGVLVFIAVWLVLGYPLSRMTRLSAFPLAVSLGLFLCMIFIVASVSGLIPFSRSAFDLARLLILVGVTGFVCTGAYFAVKGLSHVTVYRRFVPVIVVSIPFLLAAFTTLLWLYRFEIEPLISFKSTLAALAFLGAALLLIKMVSAVTRRTWAVVPLGPFLAVVLALPFVAWLTGGPSETARSKGAGSALPVKYVILIIVDTLRADYLSCYSPYVTHTPNMDGLAEEAVVFRRALSPAPWTLPAVSSIMTGLSPLVHAANNPKSRLPSELTTLAEHMQTAGYYTAGFGFNPFLTREYNMAQGFDEYYFPLKSGRSNSLGGSILGRAFPDLIPSTENTQKLTDIAIDWLQGRGEEPFFLWLHYFDPHQPYSPPTGYLPDSEPPGRIGTSFGRVQDVRGGYLVPSLSERDWIRSLYAAEVRYVDDCLGQLMDSLRERGIYDDALIILTSDHGEEFWEHGRYEHGHSLFEEVLWVPLMIKLPGSSSHGEIDASVTIESIMPTILELGGIEHDSAHLSAGSLAQMIEGGSSNQTESIMSTGVIFFEQKESVIFEDLKYVLNLVTGDEELYDLAADPHEMFSLASAYPDTLEGARELLEVHHKDAEALRDHYGVSDAGAESSDRETMERLRSLGYIR